MKDTIFQMRIKGMSCAGCASKIESHLKGQTGVEWASVNFTNAKALVSFDSEITEPKALREAVVGIGYSTEVAESDKKEELNQLRQERDEERRNLQKRVVFSLVMSVAAMYFEMGSGLETTVRWWTQFVLILPVWLWAGWPFLVGMMKSFGRAPFGMDTLIGIGTSVSFIYSSVVTIFGPKLSDWDLYVYYEGVGFIISFILLGKYLEHRATAKTSEALEALLDLTEKTARIERDQQEIFVSVDEVEKGEIVWVKPGEKIPLDGLIHDGKANIDEAIVTGESHPVLKGLGDEVIGGTINLDGSLKVLVSKRVEEGFLSRVAKLVEEAQGRKAPIQKLADRVSQIFVPIVLVIALFTFVAWWLWGPQPAMAYALVATVSVLIISCPCALGLATPTAVMVGTGTGSKRGILIRDGESLEEIHKITDVVLDKTGTITEGRFSVVASHYSSEFEQPDIERLFYSMEKQSEHPIGHAVVDHFQAMSFVELPLSDVQIEMGQGIAGRQKDRKLYVGSLEAIQTKLAKGEELPLEVTKWREQARTVIAMALNGQYAGALALMDRVRDSSETAVQELQQSGLRVWMVTGDHEKVALQIAEEVRIPASHVISSAKPSDKLNFVKKRQEEGAIVAMVGDGVNDTPALAQANVSIAMGMGTDVALNAAQMGLVNNDLTSINEAVLLSKKTMRVIRQNLLFSFFYNSLGIPLAAGVFYPFLGWQLSPVFASVAMALSSISVVSNSLRLKNWSPYKGE